MPPDRNPEQDERFMLRALELARETTALASPNPQVGCVLVREGSILTEGAHRYETRDHAEIVALKQAGDAARGATAYVTLEPCAHHGRTGPCADALIAAGVARVVAATEDPNPLVSGQGFAKIRAANIEVEVGILQQEAHNLNDAFAHFIQHRTPFVTLKAALSADGYLAPPPASRTATEPYWLTGPAARAEVQQLRHASDAILTGIGTVLADNPALTDRTGQPRRRPLLRAILDTRLRIPLDSALVASAADDLVLFTTSAAPQEKVQALQRKGAAVEIIAPNRIDLRVVLSSLAARNIISVLVEAGQRLNSTLLREDLVDKAVLFHSSTKLGPGSIPFADETSQALEARLIRTTRAQYAPDTCTTGYLHDPWPASSVR
nr:bifunctional diaminohydroxyphosphoribosylaminopyrimidine deaminase/5-amino-6-(5-phosphoribosylamino)uracil reductase RibD [Edaphobacter acidisoli]